jgi:hypothetical protein
MDKRNEENAMIRLKGIFLFREAEPKTESLAKRSPHL